MESQRGFTLAETLASVALLGLVAVTSLVYWAGWYGRERARAEVNSMRTYLQLARMEAVSRNTPCRFAVDVSTRRLRVVDLNDPSTPSDDIVIRETRVSNAVAFARPDTGFPVTLDLLAGSEFQTVFAPDGSVSEGAGLVSVLSGERYSRVQVFGAGGTSIDRWDGSSWVPDS